LTWPGGAGAYRLLDTVETGDERRIVIDGEPLAVAGPGGSSGLTDAEPLGYPFPAVRNEPSPSRA
jgi:hypothetical protein